MKEDFEKWALSKELDIAPYTFNPKFKDEFDYQDIMTQLFFECWKAAKTTESIHAQDSEQPPDWAFRCPFCKIKRKTLKEALNCCL